MQFVVSIPPDFSRDLVRGDRPAILVEADATDPMATGGLSHLSTIINEGLAADFAGPLNHLASEPPAIDVRPHAKFNPEAAQQYNTVPGLLGIVLTLTMVMITGMAITRERERGTMENLLSMPTRPIEVLIGKITPYVIIGIIQVGLILLAATLIFEVPILGNIGILFVAALPFIAGNLALGITFSTIAKNQLQAMQMTMFIFLPSILLSGFLFPFRAMPKWAQVAGEVLPVTHFMRIARGIMLKGNGWLTFQESYGQSSCYSGYVDDRPEAVPPDAGLVRQARATDSEQRARQRYDWLARCRGHNGYRLVALELSLASANCSSNVKTSS